MDLVKKWGLLLTMGCFLGAQPFDDPVMKARLQRSQAQGINESDLPPVPRGVVEPPPLPPPETHAKDSPHYKAPKSVRRHGKARAGRLARREEPAAKTGPAPKARPTRHAKTSPMAPRHAGKRAKA